MKRRPAMANEGGGGGGHQMNSMGSFKSEGQMSMGGQPGGNMGGGMGQGMPPQRQMPPGGAM